MKVVLFCGGLGMRMRDGSSASPKPMVMIGDRPLLWHSMRYYAHHGHTEFILALGYGAREIKDYFLHYEETATNDFVLRRGREVELLGSDLADWRITFVDTGLHSSIGERLRRVRPYLEGDDYFLANYADVLSDLPLHRVVDRFRGSDAVASLTAVPPQSSFHVLQLNDREQVLELQPVSQFPLWENGGFFVFRQELFDELHPGEDLVDGALVRLAERGRLIAYRHSGFWPTRSRNAPGWSSSTSPASGRGPCGRTRARPRVPPSRWRPPRICSRPWTSGHPRAPSPPSSPETDRCCPSFLAPSADPYGFWPSAPILMTWRSGRAAPSWNSGGRCPTCTSTW
jgi:glucose-1-phosphate cytidylyltransferase